MGITLANPVAAFTEKIAQPFDNAAPVVRKIANLYEHSNQQLRQHQKSLTVTFSGMGANAFTDMINKQIHWVDGIAGNIGELAGFYETCARDVRRVAQIIESAIEPFLDVVQWVLDRLTPNIVVEQGESAVHAVFSDMRAQLHREMHDAGGLFSSLVHGHFGAALHDLEDGAKGLAHLGGDVLAMVAAVEPILCQWAADIWSAVNWLKNKLNSWCLKVEDWLFGLSDIAYDTAIFTDPNSTSAEKWMAGIDMGVNIVMDIGMLIPGADIVALGGKGVLKLLEKFGLKELLDKIVAKAVTRITETIVAQVVKDFTRKFAAKIAQKYSDIVVERMLKKGLTKTVFKNLRGDLKQGLLPRVQAIIDDYLSGKITKEQAQQRLAELANLANKYDPEQLRAILKTRDLSGSENMQITYPSGNTGIAHTMQEHVNITDQDLQGLASKSNKQGGKGLATRFTDQTVAQNAIDETIANSTKLQDFIKNGKPNTNEADVFYDPNQVFGSGYQRIVVKNKGVNQYIPQTLSSLHSVKVILAKDANGRVFVLSAFPYSK
jgi:hypothetical protein